MVSGSSIFIPGAKKSAAKRSAEWIAEALAGMKRAFELRKRPEPRMVTVHRLKAAAKYARLWGRDINDEGEGRGGTRMVLRTNHFADVTEKMPEYPRKARRALAHKLAKAQWRRISAQGKAKAATA